MYAVCIWIIYTFLTRKSGPLSNSVDLILPIPRLISWLSISYQPGEDEQVYSNSFSFPGAISALLICMQDGRMSGLPFSNKHLVQNQIFPYSFFGGLLGLWSPMEWRSSKVIR